MIFSREYSASWIRTIGRHAVAPCAHAAKPLGSVVTIALFPTSARIAWWRHTGLCHFILFVYVFILFLAVCVYCILT
jgi:hypothetical protein